MLQLDVVDSMQADLGLEEHNLLEEEDLLLLRPVEDELILSDFGK